MCRSCVVARQGFESSLESLEAIREMVSSAVEETSATSDFLRTGSADPAREASINAIEHGNECDPTKRVDVCVEAGSHQVIVCVRDEGKGFDPQKVPNPRDDVNLMKLSGRGILMIEALMDDLPKKLSSSPSSQIGCSLRTETLGD